MHAIFFKKDARLFSEKIFRVSLAVAVADKRKQRPYEVAAMDLDVAAFARREDGGVERRFNHELRLAAVRGGKIGSSGLALASTATGLELLTSVSATFLKDVEVDPDDASISSVNPKGMGSSNGGMRAVSLLKRAGGQRSARGARRAATGASASAPDGASSSSAAAAVLYEQDLGGFEIEEGGDVEEDEQDADGEDGEDGDDLSLSVASAVSPPPRPTPSPVVTEGGGRGDLGGGGGGDGVPLAFPTPPSGSTVLQRLRGAKEAAEVESASLRAELAAYDQQREAAAGAERGARERTSIEAEEEQARHHDARRFFAKRDAADAKAELAKARVELTAANARAERAESAAREAAGGGADGGRGGARGGAEAEAAGGADLDLVRAG